MMTDRIEQVMREFCGASSYPFYKDADARIAELEAILGESFNFTDEQREAVEAALVVQFIKEEKDRRAAKQEKFWENILKLEQRECLVALIRKEGEYLSCLADEDSYAEDDLAEYCDLDVAIVNKLLDLKFPREAQQSVEARAWDEIKDMKSAAEFRLIEKNLVKAVYDGKFSAAFRQKLFLKIIGTFGWTSSELWEKAHELTRDPEWKGVTDRFPGYLDDHEYFIQKVLDGMFQYYVGKCDSRSLPVPRAGKWMDAGFRNFMDLLLQILELKRLAYFRFRNLAGKAYYLIMGMLASSPPEFQKRVQALTERWGEEHNYLQYSLNLYQVKELNDYYGTSAVLDKAIDVFLEKISMWEPVWYSFNEDSPNETPAAQEILDWYHYRSPRLKFSKEFLSYCDELLLRYEKDKALTKKKIEARDDNAGLPF